MSITTRNIVEVRDLQIRPWRNQDRRFAAKWKEHETLPAYLFLLGANEDTTRRESWAVVLDRVVVGRMMLRDWRELPEPSARLGTYFGPSHRRGLGRAAYRLFLDTVPVELGLTWLYGDIHETNTVALNLSLKSGFELHGGEEQRQDAEGNAHRFVFVRYRVRV